MVMIFLEKLKMIFKNLLQNAGLVKKAKYIKRKLTIEEKEYGYFLFV